MLEPLDLGVLRDFATALLIGALVGVEREKRKAEEGDRGIAGLRTFILVALIGAVAGYLARGRGPVPWLVPGSPARRWRHRFSPAMWSWPGTRPESVGLTTELAAHRGLPARLRRRCWATPIWRSSWVW